VSEQQGPDGVPPETTEHPTFAVADTPVHGGQVLAGAEELIERAIDSVLEQVPLPEGPDEDPEGAAKLQPWAETAAPPSKNKRPLAELLEQFAERVRADPDAVAGRPRGQHPAVAFFARFAPVGGGRGEGAGGGGGGGAGGGRKRRGRRGRGAAEGPVTQARPTQTAAPVAAPGPPGTGRRRRRRGGGGGGAGAGTGGGGAATGGRPGGQQAQRPPGQPPATSSGGAQAQRAEGRRRSRGRGRRRRGGGGGSAGDGGGGGPQ